MDSRYVYVGYISPWFVAEGVSNLDTYVHQNERMNRMPLFLLNPVHLDTM